MPVERQVVSVWAGTSGYLDDVPVGDIGRFESEFLDYLQRSHAGIYDAIRETGEVSEDTTTALKDAIDEFRRGLEISRGPLLVTDETAEARDEGDVRPGQGQRGQPPAPQEQENE